MKIGKPNLIINPYEWLPGYGESKVSFRSLGMDVILEVEYEKDVSDDETSDAVQSVRRDIAFRSVHAFLRMPFPGNLFFEFNGDSNAFSLGELTEFMESEWADASMGGCRPVLASGQPKVRHFSIQFLSENFSFHVLAEAVYLSDEYLAI